VLAVFVHFFLASCSIVSFIVNYAAAAVSFHCRPAIPSEPDIH